LNGKGRFGVGHHRVGGRVDVYAHKPRGAPQPNEKALLAPARRPRSGAGWKMYGNEEPAGRITCSSRNILVEKLRHVIRRTASINALIESGTPLHLLARPPLDRPDSCGQPYDCKRMIRRRCANDPRGCCQRETRLRNRATQVHAIRKSASQGHQREPAYAADATSVLSNKAVVGSARRHHHRRAKSHARRETTDTVQRNHKSSARPCRFLRAKPSRIDGPLL
jgi:hypothetical protein